MGDIIELKRRYYSGLDADKASIPATGKDIGDQYFATDTLILYYWENVNWIPLGDDVVDAGMLKTDAVETLKIKNLNVTVGKLAGGITAAKLAADCVETLKIKNLNVTPGKAALGFGRYVPVPSSAWQYVVGTLTANGAWQNNALDFTGIVPAGAIGIVVLASIIDDAAASRLQIRHDAGSTVSVGSVYTQVANIQVDIIFTLPLESDRLMDYWLSNLVWTQVSIAVLGYFI